MSEGENNKSRGRPRAFRRATVVEQAMQVFWAAGYEGASIPMLSSAMGISAQSLYNAFGSKEALYREAIDFYRATIGGFAARALSEEGDAIDAISRLLRDAASIFFRTTGTPGCLIATPDVGASEPSLIALGRDLRLGGVNAVAQRLERGLREGQVRYCTDCAAWARHIGVIVQGMSVSARDGATLEMLLSTAMLTAQHLETLRQR